MTDREGLQYVQYHSSKESTYLAAIRQLISNDLSEPYSIYVYRYFLYQWGDLCFLVRPQVSSIFVVAQELCLAIMLRLVFLHHRLSMSMTTCSAWSFRSWNPTGAGR